MQSFACQQSQMTELLETWCNVNSGTDNIRGLSRMLRLIKNESTPLQAKSKIIPLPFRKKINPKGDLIEIPTGKALFLKKHPKAPIQIFLGGHYDTVYSPTHSFQKAELLDNQILRGPGSADMKGGLIILLKSLEALEQSSFAGQIGWEVLINPDEEVGSTSSEYLFMDCAKRAQLGLIFEPSFSDGSLVSARKGSANFTIIAKGKAAHAGRDFHQGKNAITSLARFIHDADVINQSSRGVTINFGHIEGGEAANIVPDLAICRLNIRTENAATLLEVNQELHHLIRQENELKGMDMQLFEQNSRLPKAFDEKTESLFESLRTVGKQVGIEIKWQPSGGVCDGNILAAAGVPTIDTLGAVGGNIHTETEYVNLASLPERIFLTSSFLIQLAQGAIHV